MVADAQEFGAASTVQSVFHSRRRATLLSAMTLYLGILATSRGQDVDPPVVPFTVTDSGTLRDRLGRAQSFKQLLDGPWTVLGFIDQERPPSDQIYEDMRRLRSMFESKGVTFVVVYSDLTLSLPDVATHVMDVGLDWYPVLDRDGTFALESGIVIAPSFLLINAQGEAVFRGGIGWIPSEPGQGEVIPGLASALLSLLEQGSTDTNETEPSGRKLPRQLDWEATYRDFVDDVAPIVQNHCVPCHRAGGAAPFPLETYPDVMAKIEEVRDVVVTKRMPPWQADQRISRFANRKRLLAADHRMFVEWLDFGRASGDVTRLRRPVFDAGWSMGEPDAILETPEPIRPADGERTGYQVIEPTGTEKLFAEDRLIEAVECHRSSPATSKHVQIYFFAPGEEVSPERIAHAWATFSWVRGASEIRFPYASALRLPAGTRCLVEVGFTSNESEERPSIAFRFAREVPEREIRVTNLGPTGVSIPPFESLASQDAESILSTPAEIVGVLPRMNLRGRAFALRSQPPEEDERALVAVPNFHPDWQRTYWLAKPIEVPAKSLIRVTGTWDNSKRNLFHVDPSNTIEQGIHANQERLDAWVYWSVPMGTDPTLGLVTPVDEDAKPASKVEWRLAGTGQKEATLHDGVDDQPDTLRVEMTKAHPMQPWMVQLATSIGSIKKDDRVVLRLRARADQSRTVDLLVGESQSPKVISRRARLQLDQEWREFIVELSATEPAEDASYYIYLGDDSAAVTIDSVALERLGPASQLPLVARGGRVGSVSVTPSQYFDDRCRVSISADAALNPFECSLVGPSVKLEKSDSFEIKFRARASRPNSIIATVGQASPPSKNVGLYRPISLTRQWQDYSFKGTAEFSDNVNVIFFVGGATGDIDVSGLEIHRLEGKP